MRKYTPPCQKETPEVYIGPDASCSSNCGGSSVDSRTIGYYESWSTQRPCDAWYPEDLNTDLLTHINFAFAMVGPDNRIAAANDYDVDLYTRTTNLKNKNPSLKVFISVGGWDDGTPAPLALCRWHPRQPIAPRSLARRRIS